MRVLFVLNSLAVGGAERHTVDLASDLSRGGADVHLAYLADRHDLRDALAPAVKVRTVGIRRSGPVDLQAVRQLAALRTQVAPDVVVTVNQYPHTFHGWSLHGVAHAPAVVNIQHSMAYPGDNWLKLAIGRRYLGSASAIVYLTAVQRDFWHMRGVRAQREEIIANGIDLERFRPAMPQQRAAMRWRAGVRDDTLLLGCCAGLREEKRHDLVLAAAAQLAVRGVRIHVLFIGDGPQRESLEGLAGQLGLRDRLHITGYVDDVQDWLRACDVVCLASSHEVQPLALMEAQASGLPVVASAVGAVAELIDHGRTGLLFPRGGSTRLADGIQALAAPAARQAIAAQARRHAQAHYDRRQMVERYRDLLGELARQGPRLRSA
jgi:glycosyltransferase involved in cell wall biosynthesis